MPVNGFYILPLSICAAVTDLKSGKVRNLLVLAGLAAGLTMALFGLGQGTVSLKMVPAVPADLTGGQAGTWLLLPVLTTEEQASLLMRLGKCAGGALLPAALCFPLFHFRFMGAGDIKLFSAIGAIVGINVILRFMVMSIFCGGGIALLLLPESIRCRRGGRFHFTVPILMASLLYAAGLAGSVA